MTREEAIEVIKDIYNYTKWDTYTMNEARTMAIKALEQEPKTDVLDKIRNEFIDRYPRNWANELELGGRGCEFSLNEILRIIDKYKAESEV